MEHTEFLRELSSLLNRACCENVSNTPDFILAEYMQSCLVAYDKATIQRDKWYNVHLAPANIKTTAAVRDTGAGPENYPKRYK